MSTTVPGKTIRDPLWNTIHLDATAVRIVDTPEFQRLRYIRQLGLAHLVYPGATHTRFDHALGVYHLTSVALRHLRDRGGVAPEAWEGEELVPYAGLLHDIGHYAFSHALEELEAEHVPVHHEEVSQRFFASPTLRDALAPLGLSAPDRIHEIISGESGLPLRGLVSGSLDLDKMEYLRRDARFCGVPYGEVDVSRLLQGLALLEDPETGAFEVGVHEKAIAALESLLFAKYQMFRNVYWHHGVRAATGLYKRIVEESGCEINIEDDGRVLVYSMSAEGLQVAKECIDGITAEVEVGKLYRGKVVSIKDFGCFVEVLPGKDGLVHISELANFRVKKTEDIVKDGDEIWVKCIGVDDKGRIKLSRKAAMEDRKAEFSDDEDGDKPASDDSEE